MKICPICNQEYSDREYFCTRDGGRLASAAPPQPAPSHRARIRIQSTDGQSRDYSFERETVTIGAASDNTIILDDTTVSRHHAIIRWENDRYVIIDNRSTNGVSVNGARLGSEPFPLHHGDTITIGRSSISFMLQAPVSTPVPESAPPPRPARVPTPPPQQAPRPVPPAAQQPPAQQVQTPAPPQRPQQVATPPQHQAPVQPPEQRPAPPAQVPRVPTPQPRQAERSEQPPSPPPQRPRSADTPKPAQMGAERRVLDGRYELEALLGQDALGTLYRARRLALGDQVAVRVLRPSLVENKQALERFRRQALVAARIRHPNAVQIYDFIVSSDGTVYIVEELLTGRTLRDLIRTERGLTLPRVVSIFNQICGAVHAAHLNGIILRDLRPEAIHLERTPDDQELVKISGSGLAKLDPETSGGVTMADAAATLADARYMSPEQWEGHRLDSRSDVYSLGVILFELLTGIVPFEATSRYETAEMHLHAPVPELAEYGRSDLDESVNAVVSRALAKSPVERPPTALHLAAELEAVTNVQGGLLGNVIQKATGILPVRPVVVPQAPTVAAGEASLPSVVAQAEEKGRGAFNIVVLALMAEAFLSRVSGGLVKTVVPLYALLVFGLDVTSVMGLVLVQNVVPLLLRPAFGSLADRYGKKRIFVLSLVIRTLVSLLFAIANLPVLFIASALRGLADSAKGPSASAMIADNTDQAHIAKAYSWYTTTKSTSGSIGETLAVWLLPVLLGLYLATQSVSARVAIVESEASPGREIVEVIGSDPPETAIAPAKGEPARRLIRVEQRQVRLADIPLDTLPKVVDKQALRRTIVVILLISTILSAISVILVALFIQEKKKKDKSKKKGESGPTRTGEEMEQDVKAPSVYAFALLGTAITAPGYMVTGEFFLILAVKLAVTAKMLFYIKIGAELVIPLIFGPFFGWVADRVGSGKVLALRSIINLITSVLFWATSYFAASAIFGVILGLARGLDEIGKAAFKPTWGAVSAKVSSFNLAKRGKTMGTLEMGVDTSDLIFPQVAGLLFQKLGLMPLMIVRGALALIAEIYAFFLLRKHRI